MIEAIGLAGLAATAPAYALGATRSSCSTNDCKAGSADKPGRNGAATRGGQIRDELHLSAQAELQQIGQLSDAEQRAVAQLKARDREVRAHEQAHLSAAGPHARSGPSFQYQKGPDNARYAVGGEVQIDVSPVAGDPEATIRKAQIVRAAALAPANPSSQDRQVAAAATRLEAQAQQELRQQHQAEQTGQLQSRQTGQPQSKSEDPGIGALLDVRA